MARRERQFGGLARWPLLLGAIILFVLALWEESHDTGNHTTVAVVSVTVGSVLLGAWVYSVAVEAGLSHRNDDKEDTDDRPGTGG